MKEETRIEKQRKLEEIKDKYKPYFDLLSNCGGALPLRDFSILLEIEYTKTTRDLKYIENNCTLIKSYERLDESLKGTPRRSKVICLTRRGWKELTGKNRNEVKFENEETMDNIKLKAYKYTKLKAKQERANEFKEAYLSRFGSSADDKQVLRKDQERVDVAQTLSDDNLIITKRIRSAIENKEMYETERVYDIDFIATYRSLSFKRFLSDLDKMISIFEYEYDRLYDTPDKRSSNALNLNINVTCIVRQKVNISKFIHAKNRYRRVYNYYTVNMVDMKWWDSYNFKHYFKNVFKYINFKLLDDEYNLIDL